MKFSKTAEADQGKSRNIIQRLFFGSTKIYRIKGTFYHMPAFTYEQDEELIDIYNVMLDCTTGAPGEKEASLQTILHRFYEKRLVPKLFKIILKPFQPSWFHRAWNAFVAARNRIDESNLQHGMTREEWGVIVTDFFLQSGIGILPLNDFAGILGLPTSSGASKSSQDKLAKNRNPILPILFFMEGLSSMLQTRTSEPGSPSGEPMH